ncbi:UDP-glycosyltransferase 79A6-like [Vicia villosa]|uniref:UDP-glycosyltransferase 79A6-like n=1 Tax=Vicia villosa TaxID=3911 RepID=UPI00273C4DD8|nr:UDP-glycosyltransferase 79A6-like [Vicia villosa]
MSSETKTNGNDELHVAMFPFLAFGHISPFVQLSNKLFSHGIHISFLSPAYNIPKIKATFNLNPAIQIITLDFPSNIPGNTSELHPDNFGSIFHALDSMQDHVRTLLLKLKPHFVFFDFAQNWIPKIASELGIKSVHFSVYSAISGSYLSPNSRLSSAEAENRDITLEDIKNPPVGYPEKHKLSLQTFQARTIFMMIFQRYGNNPNGSDRVIQILSECSLIVFKSCREIEGPYIDHFQNQLKKPVLVSGVLVPEPSTDVLDEKWTKWLDNFPAKSVILCSFGSETFLSDEQINELATGLELTNLPFILVLNFPSNLNAEVELERALPKGFRERVKSRGIVHSGWLQQQLVLKHASVGCYVCHAGFSSVIEAMVNDCQLVLLPFKGDQFLNSKLIAYDLKAGIEVKRRDEDGFFEKEELLEAVRGVMVEVDKEPGKEIRENHKKWREFLLDEEIQNKFIIDLIQQLKSLV